MPNYVSFDEQYDSVPLSEWVSSHPDEEDLRTVFLNMDMALKYIHEHGYCIQVFYPTEIDVLNNEADHIQFNKLVELPSDLEVRREMIKELFKEGLQFIFVNMQWKKEIGIYKI